MLAGMGASHFAAYPTWLELAARRLPAWWLTAEELLHEAWPLVTGETLLWLTSQSGASAEVVALLDRSADDNRPTILGTTAHDDSPLGRAADATLKLHIGEESTVSTGSYVTTLAVHRLALAQIGGGDPEPVRRELLEAADGLAEYLENWQTVVERWSDLVTMPQRLVVVGRGPSLATALTGSLIMKESAKVSVEGMSAAQFRHGPIELADERLTVIVIAGPSITRPMAERLARDLHEYKANVVWLAAQVHHDFATVPVPDLPPSAATIAEIVPLQLLSLALAHQTGVEPGTFRHIGKVTRTL